MKKSKKNFMAMARRHEFFVLRRRLRFRLYCAECACDEDFVPLEDAVLFTGIAARQIVRRVDRGELHFLETSGGHLFVCQKSLSANKTAEIIESDAQRPNRINPYPQGEKR